MPASERDETVTGTAIRSCFFMTRCIQSMHRSTEGTCALFVRRQDMQQVRELEAGWAQRPAWHGTRHAAKDRYH